VPSLKNKKPLKIKGFGILAERGGFEPPIGDEPAAEGS
jgi:hypothetical protein